MIDRSLSVGIVFVIVLPRTHIKARNVNCNYHNCIQLIKTYRNKLIKRKVRCASDAFPRRAQWLNAAYAFQCVCVKCSDLCWLCQSAASSDTCVPANAKLAGKFTYSYLMYHDESI